MYLFHGNIHDKMNYLYYYTSIIRDVIFFGGIYLIFYHEIFLSMSFASMTFIIIELLTNMDTENENEFGGNSVVRKG